MPQEKIIKYTIITAIIALFIYILKSKKMNVSSKIIERIFKNEGGYVNDPDDQGGETKYGISKRAYPYIDIKNITKEEALNIYERDYFSKLPSIENEAFKYQIYDHAINAGVKSALKIYNDSLKTIKPEETAKLLRQEFYKKIAKGNKAKYLKGWINRTIF